jgi:multicomponent Na+:H+ antiporter subunit E
MRRLRVPALLVWLTALWLALWAEVSVANLVSGVAVGVGVLVATGVRPLRTEGDDGDRPKLAPLATLWFIVWVLGKLMQSSLFMAWEIVTPRNRITTGVVRVPLRDGTPTTTLIVASVVTLTPGTLSIELDPAAPALYVHVLHLHDVERVRASLLRVEELAVGAFGSPRARDRLAQGRRP